MGPKENPDPEEDCERECCKARTFGGVGGRGDAGGGVRGNRCCVDDRGVCSDDDAECERMCFRVMPRSTPVVNAQSSVFPTEPGLEAGPDALFGEGGTKTVVAIAE